MPCRAPERASQCQAWSEAGQAGPSRGPLLEGQIEGLLAGSGGLCEACCPSGSQRSRRERERAGPVELEPLSSPVAAGRASP